MNLLREAQPLVPAAARPTAQDARRDDERELMWRLALIAFVVGSVTAFAVLALPDPDTSDHGGIAIVAGVLAVSAAALALAGPGSRLVTLSPLWGVLCVSALVAVAQPLGAMPLFYLWPLIQAAYFLDRRPLIAVEATMLVSYAVALQFSPPGLRMAYFLAVVVCTVLVAAVISHLKQRVDGLMAGLDVAASTDPLTGLLNRRAFEEQFDREVLRSARDHRPLTLAVFDLDNFKSVNDRFGHALGDRALLRMARILDGGRRGSDLVARVGGEEFAVLFVDTDEHDAHRAAGRIASELAEMPDEDMVTLSVSAGLAARGDGLDGRLDLMRAADAALYEAKEAGRHRIVSHEGQVTVTGACAPAATRDSRTLTPASGT